MSYPGLSLGETYPSAEMKSEYSAAAADREIWREMTYAKFNC